MKFFFDLLPAILFFATYKIVGANDQLAQTLASFWPHTLMLNTVPILAATIVTITGTAMQVLWAHCHHGKVSKMLWVSFALIALFGSLTLSFHNPTFIKVKPTVLYWLFATVLFVSETLLRRNLIRSMLETQIQPEAAQVEPAEAQAPEDQTQSPAKLIRLPDVIWQRLNAVWVLFFLFMGALNLYVAYYFSEATWVNFKLFGAFGLTLIFLLAQGFYLSRHIEEASS